MTTQHKYHSKKNSVKLALNTRLLLVTYPVPYQQLSLGTRLLHVNSTHKKSIKLAYIQTGMANEENSSEKNLPTFRLNAPVVIRVKVMTTGAFSRNVGKFFSELKLVTDNLSLHSCRSQLRSH